jgi:transposase-like protein
VHPGDVQAASASFFSSYFKRLHRSAKLATSYNIVEQDHRAVKRVTRPMLGFKSFEAAQDTLVGIELMHMIKKKQMRVEAGDEGLTAAEQFYSLAA